MPTTYDVFVSYAREDLKRVQPWVQELKDGGVSAFFDMESLLGGGKWQGEIAEAIHSAKLVILFVSRSSVASEFVPKELALAVEMKKHILPVFLEETEVRGQLAFCIAGLQRVQAHGPQVNVRQILRTIQPKLREFGVEWVNPTQFLNGVRQASRRVADEATGKDNVRRTKEEEPEAAPVRESDEDEVPHGRSWTTIWLAFMMLAGAVIAFYWLGGAEWWAGGKPVQPPVGANPVSQPDPSIPPALPVRLEDEAPDLAEQYYLAANQNPAGQIALLANTVDYLGRPGWNHSDVKADLEAYAKRWTRQHFEVLAKPPQVRVIEPDKVVECDVSLRYISENAIVTSTATFTGRLRMQRFGNEAKITSVAEVPGTRKSEPLKFNHEVQQAKAIEHVTRAMLSGSSNSNMTPDSIAALYAEKSDHRNTTNKPRAQIAVEVANVMAQLNAKQRHQQFHVLEQPEVVRGLGTELVELKAAVGYVVTSLPSGIPIDKGWVRSFYLVLFGADGTPVIKKEEVIESGK